MKSYPGPKYLNGQHFPDIMERNTFDQNQFYNPRNGTCDSSTKSAASNPYPVPAQGRPRVRQLS